MDTADTLRIGLHSQLIAGNAATTLHGAVSHLLGMQTQD
jgi:hypothetical protein